MLDRFPVNPILPAQDGDRARSFYRDVLGLELMSGREDDPIMFLAGAGTSIVISEIPDRIPPPYPVVSFMVERIEELVDALKARGARFQPLPRLRELRRPGGCSPRRGDGLRTGQVGLRERHRRQPTRAE